MSVTLTSLPGGGQRGCVCRVLWVLGTPGNHSHRRDTQACKSRLGRWPVGPLTLVSSRDWPCWVPFLLTQAPSGSRAVGKSALGLSSVNSAFPTAGLGLECHTQSPFHEWLHVTKQGRIQYSWGWRGRFPSRHWWVEQGADLRLFRLEFLCSQFPVMGSGIVSLIHRYSWAWLTQLRGGRPERLLHGALMVALVIIVLHLEEMKSMTQSYVEPEFPSRFSRLPNCVLLAHYFLGCLLG